MKYLILASVLFLSGCGDPSYSELPQKTVVFPVISTSHK